MHVFALVKWQQNIDEMKPNTDFNEIKRKKPRAARANQQHFV